MSGSIVRRHSWKAGLVTWALVVIAAGAFVLGLGGGRDRTAPEAVRAVTTTALPRAATAITPTTPPSSLPPPAGPAPQFFGVSTPSGPYNLAELDSFVAATGRQPHVLMFSQDWTGGEVRRELLDVIVDRRMLPIITWEPRDHTVDLQGGDFAPYKLSRIIDGSWDNYVRQWARSVRALPYSIGVRFAQQMNGNWFPWSESVNGNAAGEYVAAWRHIHRIFSEERVTNVTWVWSPNISFTGSAPLRDLYPGDEYVDWVGLDGYNGGTALPWGGWRSPEEMYLPTLGEVREFTRKPVVLTEVASTEVGGTKADWINEFFLTLERQEDIIGFIWVESEREADWRIISSPPAREAFAAGVSRPRFTTMSHERLPIRR